MDHKGKNRRAEVSNGNGCDDSAPSVDRYVEEETHGGTGCSDAYGHRFRQPDAMLESAENDRWLGMQIGRLPSGEHAVLHLRQVEHKTTEEIAAIVGISPGSVPTLLARARRKLMEEIRKRDA